MALNTWWTGDDTPNDSSGNGHNLTIAVPTYSAGKLNDCFGIIDDTNKMGEIANYETMGGTRTRISVFAWIKNNDALLTTSLVIASHYDTTNHRQWRIELNNSAANGYLVVFLSATGTGVSKKYVYETDLTDNAWHHVGFTYLGTGTGVLKLYVDGEEVTVNKITDVAITTLYNSTAKVGMGSYFNGGVKAVNGLFNGLIDEVRIYDETLSDVDILALYNSYFAPRFQINIGDSWKAVAGVQINIGGSWRPVSAAQINIGDAWKST